MLSLQAPVFFWRFLIKTTVVSIAEAADGGLLPSLQFVDVVALRAVAMSVLPIGFELSFQNVLVSLYEVEL